MPTLRPSIRIALAFSLALAGCNGDGGDDEQARSGEVLEGTISDAMLPIDTVRSQPPLADPEAAEAVQARDATGDGDTGAARASPDSPAADAPAEDGADDAEAEAVEPAQTDSADTED